jgi:hypothetical protein
LLTYCAIVPGTGIAAECPTALMAISENDAKSER